MWIISCEVVSWSRNHCLSNKSDKSNWRKHNFVWGYTHCDLHSMTCPTVDKNICQMSNHIDKMHILRLPHGFQYSAWRRGERIKGEVFPKDYSDLWCTNLVKFEISSKVSNSLHVEYHSIRKRELENWFKKCYWTTCLSFLILFLQK